MYSMMTTAFQFPADLEDDEEDLNNVPSEREKDLAEQTFLDNVDVPGFPQAEAARRAGWRKLPQRVSSREAIAPPVWTCSKRSTDTEPKSSQGL